MVGSLRAYEKLILSKPDPAHILARFFDEFVEKMLIADYRTLKTRNNPFRYRDRIIAAIGLYETDDAYLDAFAAGYVQQGLAANLEAALVKVRQHLHQVKTVFFRAEDRLDEIDAFRMRLERKITRTITYMSQVDSSLPARVATMIQHLGAQIADWSQDVPVSSDLADPNRSWGPDNLATPRSRRATAAPSAVRIQEDDPIITEYDRRKREYLARLVVTPEKIEAFLEQSLAGCDALSAADFLIRDTEQALIFQRMRLLSVLGNEELARRFKVIVDEHGLVETQWSICSDFRVERLETVAGAAHAF